MKDPYKADVIRGEMEKIKEDEYYQVKLKGDTGKAINLDMEALRILKMYYNGYL